MEQRPGPPAVYDVEPALWRGPGAAGRYWDLLLNLVGRALKLRYKRSLLGFGWTMLNPLLTMVIFTLVFSRLFSQVENYPLYVIIGLLAYNLFSTGSSQGLASVAEAGALLRKVGVPKAIFPLAAVSANLVNFLLSLIPLFFLMLFLGAPPRAAVAWVPLGVLLLFMFTLGTALVLTTLNVFFRDVRYLYEAGLLAWFYATPVFYPIGIVPEKQRIFIELNPLVPVIETFRAPLYGGVAPSARSVIGALAAATVALSLGIILFKRYERRFIDYI